MINNKTNEIESDACFNVHKNYSKNCNNTSCRYWHNLEESNNCIINKSNNNPHTLQEIGNILGITRMRVCQIEKIIIKKLKNM